MIKIEHVARQAIQHSYCPYSKFRVGAAVLTRSGHIFSGCNIENVAFGPTVCAERTAIFKAVSEGHRDIVAVVVYTPTAHPTTPCGVCRQVINEFAPTARVLCICDSDERIETTLDKLLPEAFVPRHLGES